MKYLTTLLLAIVLSLTTKAHNPQLATLTLMQENGDKWGLLIAVPFTTCQLALQNRYPGLNTDSVDINRFNDLLTGLIQENSLVIINNNDTLLLTNARIKPGHETEIYFQVQQSVNKINSLKVVFNAFASLQDQNTIFRIYQSGKSEGNFILNSENQYAMSLQKEVNGYSVIDNPSASNDSRKTIIAILSVLLLPAIFFSYKTIKSNS